MATFTHNCAIAAFVVIVSIGYGSAQIPAEKHVKDIKAEQTPEVISASFLCQQRLAGSSHLLMSPLNPATLESDLTTLLRKSDEVVMTGGVQSETSAISPSGKYSIHYMDVRVLHSWKGSHQAGDVLTFGIYGTVGCAPNGLNTVSTVLGNGKWLAPWTPGSEPAILFLIHDTNGWVDGLRLTGGNGTQGLFVVKMPDVSLIRSYLRECRHAFFDPLLCTVGNPEEQLECKDLKQQADNVSKCDAILGASTAPVVTGNVLPQKYDGMAVTSFLREIQSIADSMISAEDTSSTK